MAKVSGYVVQLSRPKLSNAAKGFLFTWGGSGRKIHINSIGSWFIGKMMFFFQVGGWEFSSKKPLIMGSIENDWERP